MEKSQRRLAAIMFSDIVGYSKLMGDDEAAMLRLLQEHNELIVPIVQQHGGTVLKFIGDAILSSYDSASSAVLCAVAIQKALAERNQAKGGKPLLVRIGVHIGDVTETAGDVFGDGVNIAARIQPLAEPGGICISQTVYHVVRAQAEIRVESMGQRELKNIKESVHIYKVQTGPELAAPAGSAAVAAAGAGARQATLALAVSVAALAVVLAVALRPRGAGSSAKSAPAPARAAKAPARPPAPAASEPVFGSAGPAATAAASEPEDSAGFSALDAHVEAWQHGRRTKASLQAIQSYLSGAGAEGRWPAPLARLYVDEDPKKSERLIAAALDAAGRDGRRLCQAYYYIGVYAYYAEQAHPLMFLPGKNEAARARAYLNKALATGASGAPQFAAAKLALSRL